MDKPMGPDARAVRQAQLKNNRLKASYLTAADTRNRKAAAERRRLAREAEFDKRMQELLAQARVAGAQELEQELDRIRELSAQVKAAAAQRQQQDTASDS